MKVNPISHVENDSFPDSIDTHRIYFFKVNPIFAPVIYERVIHFLTWNKTKRATQLNTTLRDLQLFATTQETTTPQQEQHTFPCQVIIGHRLGRAQCRWRAEERALFTQGEFYCPQ